MVFYGSTFMALDESSSTDTFLLETIAPSEFDRNDVEIKERHTLFQGFFRMLNVTLRHRLFDGGWSPVISRELFQRGDAAAAVLFDPKHKLIGLVEQFRVGALDSEFGPWCLEVVAGMMEAGETPEQLIRRELEEEAGIQQAELIPISSYYSTPGGCSEKIHLFCAICDLKGAEGIFGLADESEDIRLHILPSDDVFAGMLHSRANNATTLIGLQWLQLHSQRLIKEYV